MLRPLGTVALGLLVAAGAAAQDSTAPLAGTKKELQELRDRPKAVGGPDVKDGLKSVGPVSGPAASGGDPLPPRLRPENLEKERRLREQARQNWLLNGMNRLKGETDEARSRTRDKGPAGADDEGGVGGSADSIDASDPAYLLKLYDRQKRLAADKAAAGATERTPSRAADPLGPFLQGWLANSPVRDQALAGTPRQSIGSRAGGLTADPSAAAGTSPGNPGPGTGTRQNAVPNPYLADPVAAPAAAPSLSRPPDLPAKPATEPLTPPPAVARPGPPSTQGPAAEPAPESRRVAPPPANDDKKYFPQLKKF